MTKIAVIGGGPAGFMAAINASENCNKTINIDIYEKKQPLKTILLTGHGRCNLTNATYDFKELASNYPRGEKFLYSVFSKFGVKETIDWFTSHGLEIYIQQDNRIFPLSNDANTVRNLLINIAKNLDINIKSNMTVSDINHIKNKFKIYSDNNTQEYDKVIIATGGKPKNNIDSGYQLAKKLGHKITELKPSLTGLITKEKWFKNLAGVTVKNAKITAIYQNKTIKTAFGDFLFTHKGLSGPLIFKISSFCAFLPYNQTSPLVLKLDFIPQITYSDLELLLIKEFEHNSNKNIANIIDKFVPKSVIQTLLNVYDIPNTLKACEVTKIQRKTIINMLKETRLTIISVQPDGEIVTAGGVELKEVNSATMESKLIKGLYFCGEILNIDGLTGGFNLQACWSTGYIAGINAIK